MLRGNLVRLRAGLKDRIKYLMGGTKVYALVGASGTGKSFRAKLVSEKYSIDYIIDDGLLIQGNSIVAGKSAKKERVYMKAVKTALFDDSLHRHEVVKAIKSRKIRKLLLLGTSERMVAHAARQLGLPAPSCVIQIEEISSKEDIEKAQLSRNNEGKHVIPVPSLEVERDHPSLIPASIKVLYRTIGQKFHFPRGSGNKLYEKSVVQPSFHKKNKGKLSINESGLGQMVAHCVDEFDSDLIVRKIRIRPKDGAYHLKAEIEVPYGKSFGENMPELQSYIVDKIEQFTGIQITNLNLVVAGVSKWNRHHSQVDTAQIEVQNPD